MITATGYKQVGYNTFLSMLTDALEKSGKNYLQVAADIRVGSVETAKNAFCKTSQKVSDKVLTNVMQSIGLNGFVLHQSGVRHYYIKSK